MKFWLVTWPLNQVRKLVMLEDYFEEKEEQQQQQPASAEVAITMGSKINPLLYCLSSHGQRKGTVCQM